MGYFIKRAKNSRFSSLFLKLNFVFMVFFIMPVIIASLIFRSYSINTIEKEVNQANNSILKHACDLTDTKLAEIQRTIYDLSGRYYVWKLMDKISNQEESIQLLSNSIDDIHNIKNINDFISGIFVYYKTNDFLVTDTGKMDINIYFNRICKYEGMNVEYWKKIFECKHSFNYTNTTNVFNYNIMGEITNRSKLLTIITTLPYDDKPKAVIGIQINEDYLDNLLDNIGITKKGNVYIITKDGYIIAHSHGYIESNNPDTNFLKTVNVKAKASGLYVLKKNEKYMISSITSKFTGWTFIAEIPENEITQKSQIIKIVTISICIFFMLVATKISLKVSKWVYNPIRDLADKLYNDHNSKLKKNYKINEIKAINIGVDSILTKNQKLERILHSNIEGLQQNFFCDLVYGKFGNEEFLVHKAQEMGIEFKHIYYTLSAIKFEFYNNVYKEYPKAEINKIETYVCKLIEDYLSKEGYVPYTVETSRNSFALVINSSSNNIILLKQCYNEIIKLINFDNVVARLSISVSSYIDNLVDIPILFENACKTIKYRTLIKKIQVVDTNDLDELIRKSVFDYPFKTEESIENHLLSGNYAVALEEVTNVIDKNIENDLPYEFLKDSMAVLMNTLNKVLTAKNITLNDIFAADCDIYYDIKNFSSIEEIKEYFTFVYEKVGKYIQKAKRSNNEVLLKQLMGYLNDNYDKDIYLELFSELTGTSPKYVSRFFKEQTGINLVDYLNKLRIQKAKELLKSNSVKIVDIYNRVGFDNVNSFIRTFKKYEGIPPGQYKEIQNSII